MKPLFLLASLAIMSSTQAIAQTGNSMQPAPVSPCQAEPDAGTNSGNTGGAAGTQTGQNGQPDGLTGKLDPCNGVLKPPPTGDTGMTEPAPDKGKTPIIKPGEVPPQAPKD